ncbi:uncharacterized protein [Amphiura filiformis]|uniref:uncharacterized protein n=1 Tax=Amphiura filiformis TaxID=82378 RepID=UPI003B21FE48
MANSGMDLDETNQLHGENEGYNSINTQIKTNIAHGDTYTVSLILMPAAVTIGFTLVLAAVLSPKSLSPKCQVEEAFAVVNILLSICLMCLYVCFMMMYKNTDRTYFDISLTVGPKFGSGDKVDYFLVGSLFALNVCSVVDCVTAFTSSPSNTTIATDVIIAMNAVEIVLLIIQLIFTLFFIPRLMFSFNFEDKKTMYAFATLTTLQMCSWLVHAFEPLITLEQQIPNFPDSSLCGPIGDNANNGTCKLQIGNIYFDSFHIEYSAILTAFLFITGNRVMYSSPDRALPPNQQHNHARNLNENKCKLWTVILVSLVIAIGYLVVLILATYNNKFDDTETGYNLLNGTQIPAFGFLVILAGKMIWDSNSGNTPLFMSEYIIIVTSLFDVFWYTLRDLSGIVCAIFDETVRTPAIVSVIWTTIGICNTVTQTYLIVDIRRIKEKVPLWFRYALILFCCLNFAEWISRIFVIGAAKESGNPISPMVNALFGVYATEIISIIAFPIMNLYRLYFALFTLELIFKKELYKPND